MSRYCPSCWEPKHGPIVEPLDTYDWAMAFGYAPGGIKREDVAEVLHHSLGCNDHEDWVCIARVHDGQILYLSAGCDFTGWDCQASGHGDMRATLDEVIRELCTDDDRKRLGLALPKGEA